MVSEEEEINAKLQSSFSCLGFSCIDIGTYRDGNGLDFVDRDFFNPLAGYVPSSDVRHTNG